MLWKFFNGGAGFKRAQLLKVFLKKKKKKINCTISEYEEETMSVQYLQKEIKRQKCNKGETIS